MAPSQRGPNTNEKVSPRRRLRLSPTALQAYLACPRQYELKYLLREPVVEEPSPLLAQGKAVHAALDQFFGLAPDDRSLEVLHRALRSVWRREVPASTFLTSDEEREWGESALALLTRFHEHLDTSVIPLAREEWVSTRLPSGAVVFGRVDRVDGIVGPAEDGREQESLSVIDYKTGKRRIEPEDLADEPAAQVYAVATEAATGYEVSRVRLLYLGGPEPEEVRWEPEREDIEAARERLVLLTDQIVGATSFPTTPGPHCKHCPFRLRCPDANRVTLADLAPVTGEAELPF